MESRDDVLEFYLRAESGEEIGEKEFDAKVLPGKLRELTTKYGIKFDREQLVAQDLDMAERVFEAGRELLETIGLYCISTGRTIKISRTEIDEALSRAPSSHKFGCGSEVAEGVGRAIGDPRRPLVKGGPNGCPQSSTYFLPIMTSVAKEDVDGLHTGALVDLDGVTSKATSPIELLACKKEALWARQAAAAAGKPGLGIVGIMSGVTSEAQDAGDFRDGMRSTDPHLVVFLNEMKFDFDLLKKVLHDKYEDAIIEACSCPLFGGYSGGVEGTAITAVAEALAGFVMCDPANFVWYPQSVYSGSTTDRQTLQFSTMSLLAFRAVGVPVLLDAYVGPAAGPCTDMIFDEIAAQAVAHTAAGVSALYGACGAKMVTTDHVTGMESRILRHASEAAAGMDLVDANETVTRLLSRYEETTTAGRAPLGKAFSECYDVDAIVPSEEYETLWQSRREDLIALGQLTT